MTTNDLYSLFFKRLIDICFSLIVLVCFSWLYVVIGVLVYCYVGTPVIFRQYRAGRMDPDTGKERIFLLYKFRTMSNERDRNGNLLADDKRLSAFGKWLRSTSLDEIPEFINILKGDMSLIGPRPLLVQYLDRYNDRQHHRHDVRPGLTGYAQTHGRNGITWEDRFEMDIWYSNNVTFSNDLKIIIDTIKTIIKRDGISSETSSTMEEFSGSPDGVTSQWRAPY